ncbi:MAG TPA: DUF4149 domain-containing protein [Bryobacteraceae bacterium]|nr:DUF4149 domain-containing protein [Bryobacteraceae bacterium]
MFLWLFVFLGQLCLALWLGGLAVIDLVETPIRFRAKEITRQQAVAIGTRVFAEFNRIEVILGALLVCAWAILLLHAPDGYMRAGLLAGAGMWLTAMTQAFYLRPRISARRRLLNTGGNGVESQRVELQRFHRAYVTLDYCKMVLGIAGIGLWAALAS